MDEGEISFIGFDIGWISFFHDEEEKEKFEFVEIRFDLIGRY